MLIKFKNYDRLKQYRNQLYKHLNDNYSYADSLAKNIRAYLEENHRTDENYLENETYKEHNSKVLRLYFTRENFYNVDGDIIEVIIDFNKIEIGKMVKTDSYCNIYKFIVDETMDL